MPWAVYLWPGLPQLAERGSWAALVVAFGAAALLNVALLGTFVWTELLAPDLRILYWSCCWLRGVVRRGFPAGSIAAERVRTESDENTDAFREALDYYLQGNWFEAQRTPGRLLRKDRRDVDARLMLATLLRHTGRCEEAARQLTCSSAWTRRRSGSWKSGTRRNCWPSPAGASRDKDTTTPDGDHKLEITR